ncbi:type II toxin-antitoxin system VapC family toxin [Altericista sp. CCNU0014]|uniref:type II toxin-antitoxin system VapC family toxin n=1 Tax=Altericista sp. CCNU0014 TaxID=3082949 RepID=UPI00384AE248
MTLWILDTDHISLLQRGHPVVEQRIRRINLNDIALTIVSVEEQLYGRLNNIRRAKFPEALKTSYKALYETLEDFKATNVLEFNPTAIDLYQEMVRQKIRVGTQDLRIAAIALSVNGILVTRNQRDFAKVPNLVLEDWSTIIPS